jgi:hypothetical protein
MKAFILQRLGYGTAALFTRPLVTRDDRNAARIRDGVTCSIVAAIAPRAAAVDTTITVPERKRIWF